MALGDNPAAHQAQYRSFFISHVGGELLADIRYASNKGLVLGNDCFVDKLETLCG